MGTAHILVNNLYLPMNLLSYPFKFIYVLFSFFFFCHLLQWLVNEVLSSQKKMVLSNFGLSFSQSGKY